MNEAIWDQLESILEQAKDLGPKERNAFFQSCSDHEVFNLEEGWDETERLLGRPIVELLSDLWEVFHREKKLPRSIGPYKILGLLGEGGMGTVYLAFQQEPVKRKVALKILKPGCASKEAEARLQAEYRALGRLNHPYTAHFFDAGIDPEGRPYFTMDYFPGKPITRFCRKQALDLDQRVALMQQVCEGVQHAHQKGIIHRDIKPSNILVALQGGKPVVKVIDFGIAKAVSGLPLGDLTLNTIQGGVLGTLAYMSPEQTEGPAADVDTRADVYGLGAVLYELLTGVPPHDRGGLDSLSYDRMLTVIREEDITLPSIRVLASSGEMEHVQPEWSRRLRGELDWIVRKALEKSRGRRYAGVGELAADLQRFLSQEPVNARPPSRFYRAGKFVRRHRAGVAASLVIAVVLALGSFATLASLIRTQRAKLQVERSAAEAKAQADKFKALYGFITDTIAAPNPFVQDRNIKVVDLLSQMEERIGLNFPDQPAIQYQLYRTLGYTYQDLGWKEKSKINFQKALHQAERRTDDKSDFRLALFDLANVYLLDRKFIQSGLYLDRLQTHVAGFALNDGIVLEAERLAIHLTRMRGEAALAIPRYKELIQRQLSVFSPNGFEVLDTMNGLGIAYLELRQLEQAADIFSMVIKGYSETHENLHPEVLYARQNLAGVYALEGEFSRARSQYERILEVRREKLGENHPDSLDTLHDIGWTYLEEGKYSVAEPLLKRAVDLYVRVLGKEHSKTLWAKNTLAMVILERGQTKEAIACFNEIGEIQTEKKGDENDRALTFLHNLGFALWKDGQIDRADIVLKKVLEKRKIVLGPEHHHTLSTMYLIGKIRLERNEYEQAEVLFRKAFSSAASHTKALYQANLGYALIKLGWEKAGRIQLEAARESLILEKNPGLDEVERLMNEVGLPLK